MEPASSLVQAPDVNTTGNEKKRKLDQILDSPSSDSVCTDDTTQQPASKKRRLSSTIPTIVYKPHETLFDVYKPGKTIRVFIATKHLLSKEANRHIWGTDVYTDDSDIVAACQHAGKFYPEELERAQIKGAIATVNICPPERKYTATFRNNVRSKSWYYDDDKADNSKPNYNLSHNAIKIESLRIIFDKNTSTLSKKYPNKNKPEKFVSVTERAQHVLLKMNNNVSENLKKLDSGVVGELEQYRFLPNVTLVFNLSNEPCIKYNLHTVADKGIDNKNSTRHRVQHDGEVIYLESAQHRYELTFKNDTFCFARVNAPFAHVISTSSVPLPDDKVTVLHQGLAWTDFLWGPCSVKIVHQPADEATNSNNNNNNAVEYAIQNLQFAKRT